MRARAARPPKGSTPLDYAAHLPKLTPAVQLWIQHTQALDTLWRCINSVESRARGTLEREVCLAASVWINEPELARLATAGRRRAPTAVEIARALGER